MNADEQQAMYAEAFEALVAGDTAPAPVPPTAPQPIVAERASDRPSEEAIPGFEDLRGVHLRNAKEPMLARLQLAADFPDALVEPSGISLLDEAVQFSPGTTNVIAARQGGGKSALMLQMARYQASRGPVLYLLTEMTLEAVVLRIIANVSQVPVWQLKKRPSAEMLAKSEATLDWLAEHSNLSIVQVQGCTAAEIEKRARKWGAAQTEPPRAMYVDNLWGVAQAGATPNSSSMVSISMGQQFQTFNRLSYADALDCPVIVAHHTNRGAVAAGRTGQGPGAESLGGSDHIGNWADNVVLIVKREDGSAEGSIGFDGNPVPTHDALIVKNREGAPGKLPLVFIGEQLRFEATTEPAKPFNQPKPVASDEAAMRAQQDALPAF